MKVPLRIYYDAQTGQPIQSTGNFEDRWLKTIPTVDWDIQSYKTLSERNRETFDYIELSFGAYRQDFAECNGYRVNPETKELEFSYSDPNEPEEPQPYQTPLSEQIKQVKIEQAQANSELVQLIMLMSGGSM